MRSIARDVRFALRGLVRRPAFAITASGTLALGIGAAVATFSIVDAVLLRPLPYDSPERLVAIWETRPSRGADRLNAAPVNFEVWRERAGTLDAIVGFTVRTREVAGVDEPARVDVVHVTDGFFGTLGLEPRLGRLLQPGDFDVGDHRVAILGYEFWSTRLGGDPEAVGRRLRVDGVEHVIIGVMPPGEFDLLALRGAGSRAAQVPVWLPLAFEAPGADNPIGHWLTAVGRLGAGSTLEGARTEMASIATALERERPEMNEDWSVRLQPLHDAVVGEARPVLLMLSGAVALVLLIACTNVANLLLIRGRRRLRELAIRCSLGAQRRDLARHLVAESTGLALAGGAGGVLLAAWALEGLRRLGISGFLPRGHAGIDASVLLLALALSLVAAWVAALLPIRRSTSGDATAMLRARDSGEGMRGGSLAIAQVALSVVLVVSAGLLLRSLSKLGGVDPGFRTSDVVVVDLTLSPTRYPEASRTHEFFRRVLDDVSAAPGVQEAGAITRLPLSAEGWCGTFIPLDRPAPEPGDAPCAEYRSIRGDYFAVMGIPILEGRGLGETDDGSASGAMVVSATMASRFWPDGRALGARVAWGDTFRIVGIAGDVRHFGLDRPPTPQFYVHQLQDPNSEETRDLSLVVRATGGTGAIADLLRSRIRGLDPNLPIQDVRPLEGIRRDSVAGPRVRAVVLVGFGAIALALSILGTYAVLGYYVAGRMREMAIRVAMGARRVDLVELVLIRGLGLVVVGIGIGALLTWPATNVLSAFLFDISSTDPLTLAFIAVLFLAAGLLACCVPALRASRADPAVTLRLE